MKKPFQSHLKVAALDRHANSRNAMVSKLTELLSEILRFSYTVVYAPDGQLGHRLPDGNWTGIMGMLQREECDVTFDPLAISNTRRSVADFSYPHLLSDITFVTKKPKAVPKKFAIFDPFSLYIWLSIALSFVSVFIAFGAISKNVSPGRLFFVLLGYMFYQPTSFRPKKLVLNFLMFTWTSAIFFLVVSYKTTLLSYLSFPAFEGIRNVKELSEAVGEGRYKCMTRRGSLLIDNFSNSSDQAVRMVGKSLVEHSSLSMDVEEFLEAETEAAFVSTRPFLMHLQEKYLVSEDSFVYLPFSVAFAKRFCCKRRLEETLHRITEVGLYDEIVSNVIFNATLKGRAKIEEEKYAGKLSFDDLSGAFILLLVGHSFGILTLFMEIVISKISNNRTKM